MRDSPTGEARRSDTFIVAAVAAITRFAMVAWAYSRIGPVADGTYYHTMARRLAEGHGYTWLWPDGTVTAAAHYPVGYPALVSAGYRLFGAHPGVAMIEAAILGVAGAAALYAFARERAGRRGALAVGLAFALHPALVSYTPALMTEGVTASLLAIALYLVGRAIGSPRPYFAVGFGLAIAAATYVRPQNILFAPLLPLASVLHGDALRPTLRRAAATAAIATATCFAAIAPWTIRNCDKMGMCALVSVNGGWNLHIGTNQSAGGTWAPIEVPLACRTVWDEAAKDACFGREARSVIADEPFAWLALVPKKLVVTFEYFGAGPWYLHAANPEAFPQSAKTAWAAAEIVFHRLLLAVGVGALLRRFAGMLPLGERSRRLGPWVVGALCAASGAVGTLASGLLAGFAALAPRVRGQIGLGVPLAATVILATAAVHAVYFGAGRYGLVVIPALALLLAEALDPAFDR